MKTIGHILVCVVLVFSLFACGKKVEKVSVDKEGNEYKVDDDVSFYYPKEFKLEMNTTNDEQDPSTLRFIHQEQVFYYTVERSNYDNEPQDMKELYYGELEQMNASSIKVKPPVLDSGLSCYEFSGQFKDTGIKFTNLVYFENQTTYIYGYQAKTDVYNKEIKKMLIFLESFYKSSGKLND